MTNFSLKLSAYLDGELNAEETTQVEARLASDPEAQAELDALMEADALALEQFDGELSDPVSLTLVQQIKNTPLAAPVAVPKRTIWAPLAASFVIFALGGAGGYWLKDQGAQVVVANGWLNYIADYHAVYASQGRHLVEVGADESDHIETWLGNTVGTKFTIPDLSTFNLTFEGGRLLVANGKPVAQLMYRQPDGTVIALCLQSADAPTQAPPQFKDTTINGFDFVSWKTDGAAYVVIGPNGQSNLGDIALAAATDI
jgi:anti-sigma factor RsiW